jgi:hypothetical protein
MSNNENNNNNNENNENNNNNENNEHNENNEELINHNYESIPDLNKIYIKYLKKENNNKTESSYETEIQSLSDEIDDYFLSIDDDIIDNKSNYIILSEIIINNKNELLKNFDKSMFIYNDHGKITNAIILVIEYNTECVYKKINNNFINIYKLFYNPDSKIIIDCDVNKSTIKHFIDYINKNFSYDMDILNLNNNNSSNSTNSTNSSNSNSKSKSRSLLKDDNNKKKDNLTTRDNSTTRNNTQSRNNTKTKIINKNNKKFVNYIGKEIILISPNKLLSIYNNSKLLISDKYINYLMNNVNNLIYINDRKIYINIDINMNNNNIDVKLYNKINDKYGYIYTNFLKKYDNKITEYSNSVHVKKYVVAKILESLIESKKYNSNNINKIPDFFKNSIYYFGFELDNILIPLFEKQKGDINVIIPLYLKLYIIMNNTVKKENIELLIVFKKGILYIYLFEIIDDYFDYKVYDILLNKLSTQIEILISNTLLYNKYNKIKFGGIVINDNIKFRHKRFSTKIIKFYENYFNMLYLLINKNYNPNEISHFFGDKIEEYFIKFLNLIEKINN